MRARRDADRGTRRDARRLTASVRLFTRGATPIGALSAGALAGLLTPRATLAILMVLLALTPAWL
jgi:hypothetical protein